MFSQKTSIFSWFRNIFNHYHNLLIRHCHRFCSTKSQLSESYDDDVLYTWPELPDSVIKKIVSKLRAQDRVRCLLVSKTWRNILRRRDIPMPPQIPWLVHPEEDGHGSYFSTKIRIQNIAVKRREFYLDLPKLPKAFPGGWFCASSHGWMLIANLTPELYLWNPLSHAVRKLPPLSTIPFIDVSELNSEDAFYLSSYVKQVEVFSVSGRFVVAVVFSKGGRDYLTLCRPEEKRWCILQEGRDFKLDDLLFHDGKLYALLADIDETEDKVQETTYEVHLDKGYCRVEICLLRLAFKIDRAKEEEEEDGVSIFRVVKRAKFSNHLVRSSATRGLLVVTAIFDRYEYNNAEGPVETVHCLQTSGFEVRKFPGMERITNMGDQALYVSSTGSVSVSGVRIPNRIKFSTTDALGSIGDHKRIGAREIGVFYVGRNDLRKTQTHTTLPIGFRDGWLTPSFC